MLYYNWIIKQLNEKMPSNFPRKYVDKIIAELEPYKQESEEEGTEGVLTYVLDIPVHVFTTIVEAVVEEAREERRKNIEKALSEKKTELRKLLETKPKEASEEELKVQELREKYFPTYKTPEAAVEPSVEEAEKLLKENPEVFYGLLVPKPGKKEEVKEEEMKKETSLKIDAQLFNLFDAYDTAGSSWELEGKKFKRKTIEEDIEQAVREGGLWTYDTGDEVLINNGAYSVPVKVMARVEGRKYIVANGYGEEFEISEDDIFGDSYNLF